MEHYIIAVIQGIVEGLTEFIPVSSTGHLILAGSLLGFEGEKANTFEVVIQLGAILAIVFIYWQRLLSLVSLAPRKANGFSLAHLLIGCIPAGVIGLAGEKFIDKYLFSPQTVVVGLVLGGFFMIYADKIGTRATARNLDQITYGQALKVGLAQVLAMWPGFSRSGATISMGLITGMDRKTAADFSFLMAVPIMLGASGLKLLKHFRDFNRDDVVFLAIGFIVSFVVAWFAVVGFLRLLNKVKLTPFAVYRFIVAVVFAILLFQGIVH